MACPNSVDIGVEDFFHRPILVPCGVCPNCRADKVSLLNARAKYEWKKSEFNAFVRFSYDDVHLPYKNYVVSKDGSVSPCGLPTVSKSDFIGLVHSLKDWFRYSLATGRKLPKNCSSDFKWLGCSEYGSSYGRPHLHFLFFGLDFAYIKPLLVHLWPFGSIDVRPVEDGSIRYVLDYLEKQVNNEFNDKQYFDKNIEPPFVKWSKGFGRGFFVDNADSINKFGSVVIGNTTIPVSSYWRNQFFAFDEKKIRELDYARTRRRLSKSAQATMFGFRGSRAQKVKQFERYNSLLSCQRRLVKGRESLGSVDLDQLAYVNRHLQNVLKYDLRATKIYLRR